MEQIDGTDGTYRVYRYRQSGYLLPIRSIGRRVGFPLQIPRRCIVTISTKTIDVNLHSRDSNSLKGLCMYQPLTKVSLILQSMVNGWYIPVKIILSTSTTLEYPYWHIGNPNPPLLTYTGIGKYMPVWVSLDLVLYLYHLYYLCYTPYRYSRDCRYPLGGIHR